MSTVPAGSKPSSEQAVPRIGLAQLTPASGVKNAPDSAICELSLRLTIIASKYGAKYSFTS